MINCNQCGLSPFYRLYKMNVSTPWRLCGLSIAFAVCGLILNINSALHSLDFPFAEVIFRAETKSIY